MSTDIDIIGNLSKVKQSIPDGVELVAVSKFHPKESILTAYDAGQRVFGESREQELSDKHVALPTDIKWHFIGHLQTNKVKYIAPYIYMIDAVDSFKLLKEIDTQAAKHNRVVRVLLELHIAQEENKFGLTPNACKELLEDGAWRTLKHVQICGLMTMASHVDDENKIRYEFGLAANLFDELKSKHFADDKEFCQKSWGMSQDYCIAVECGSTMVRVGTVIFGERQY